LAQRLTPNGGALAPGSAFGQLECVFTLFGSLAVNFESLSQDVRIYRVTSQGVTIQFGTRLPRREDSGAWLVLAHRPEEWLVSCHQPQPQPPTNLSG
jgi:hypothetical protein